MIAYKLFRLKGGRLYPLFINKKEETKLNEWLKAECYPTKNFAVRQGWHCCKIPFAPHLKLNLASGEKRVWVECDVKDFEEYDRPESQGGNWVLAQELKVVRILSDMEHNWLKQNKIDWVVDYVNELRRQTALKNYMIKTKAYFTMDEKKEFGTL